MLPVTSSYDERRKRSVVCVYVALYRRKAPERSMRVSPPIVGDGAPKEGGGRALLSSTYSHTCSSHDDWKKPTRSATSMGVGVGGGGEGAGGDG